MTNTISDSDIELVRVLEDLYRDWEPNAGQVAAGKALFYGSQLTQFIRWGRKGGKTDYIIKAIYRYAMLHPNAGCYYFCPQANQAREILWETGRLQGAIPKKYISKVKSNDMRIVLKNGSFIKLDGSDNYEKHRGTEPHFLVYDEFKDFDRRFHEAIDPNRSVYNAPLIILGTPPVSINEDRNYEQYMELQKQCMNDEDKFFLQLPSFVNAHNVPKSDKTLPYEERRKRGEAFLLKKRDELIARGEEYRWKIEYMAENVTMGKNAVFPMLDKKKVMDHDEMMERIYKDESKLDWYCIADPGSSTCFAVLFAAINPYTKEVWLLDEIYEKDREKTTTRQIVPRIKDKMDVLAPNTSLDEWFLAADEAAQWFINEAQDQVDKKLNMYFNDTDKHNNKQEDGISLIKDCLLYKFLYMSNRCVNLYWEMEQYTCIDGKYPTNHDHLVDCLRYLLAEDDYDMVEALELRKENNNNSRMPWNDRFDDDEDDWTKGIL